MKIVSYNINGIRAANKLGLLGWIKQFDADIFCLQEVRCSQMMTKEILFGSGEQMDLFDKPSDDKLTTFYPTYNCGSVAGYAGTLILSKEKPSKVFYDMGKFWADDEGRTTTVVFNDIAVVNAYIPNGNSRLEFKMKYLNALTQFIQYLQKQYKVICVGDFNIAHNEIDLTNPKECKNKSVFLPIERKAMDNLLKSNLVDAFRALNPDKIEYSWRSYRSRKDPNYKGWKYRIDYVLVDSKLAEKLEACELLDLIYSDHLPVVCKIKI